MSNPVPLQYDTVYHIYNRGNNGENLFIEERNYRYFLRRYGRHIHPVVETYAYCLLRNHFHLLIRVRTRDDFREWPFSSYSALRSTKRTRLQRDLVLEWFGGQEGLVSAHDERLLDIAGKTCQVYLER